MHALGSSERADAIRLLLESYVLQCVEPLPESRHVEIAEAMSATLGATDDWLGALRAHLDLPVTLDAEILSQWRDGSQSADDAGFSIEPAEFARIVVDRYMEDLVAKG